MTDAGRQDRINKVVRQYGQPAREQLLKKDDELQERITDAKAQQQTERFGAASVLEELIEK